MSGSQPTRSPPEHSPLSQTPVQWTLAVIATVSILVMWHAGLGSSPEHRAAGPGHSAAGIPEPVTLLRIDLNRADARELSLLPGVGPVLARRIVSSREQHGQFVCVDDLSRVHGVGPKTIERLGEVCEVNR